MRTLARNKQPIYYALFVNKTDVIDENGNITGAFTLNYTDPKKLEMNVSASKGTSDMEQFGISENYTKTMMTDDINCPIKEDSRLWIGLGQIGTFDTLSGYSVGDMVIYGNGVYKCASDTVGAFDESKWEEVPYNYCVIRVAKSLNSILYAIKEVSAS